MPIQKSSFSKYVQKFINYFYRYPMAKHRYIIRMGGYYQFFSMVRNQNKMIKFSHTIPAIQSYEDGLPIYFLTGKFFLYQTLFCIQSLLRVSDKKMKYHLIDDGSLDDELIKRINKQLPGAVVITQAHISQYLLQKLPIADYPILHRKRKEYPHIKKLIDVHVLPGQWKLVLDSDMLFWKSPHEILSWLEKPECPIYMLDCQQSYGYSNRLMEKLGNTKIPNRVNVGVIGLKSENINWFAVESWINQLEQEEGTSYYLEQALSAMIIGNQASVILPAADYIVNPDKEEIEVQKGILHHYVDLSKKGYYKKALEIYNLSSTNKI